LMKVEDKLYWNRYRPDNHSHLEIADPKACLEKCDMKPCTYICPAEVYAWNEEREQIIMAYEGCLECGACLYGCPYSNIDWGNPRGGYGVMYKFG